MADEKFIVAARVDNDKDCIIAPEDAMITATHRKVYGPDTKENCEKWKSRNCN